jgi:hypothetical protein
MDERPLHPVALHFWIERVRGVTAGMKKLKVKLKFFLPNPVEVYVVSRKFEKVQSPPLGYTCKSKRDADLLPSPKTLSDLRRGAKTSTTNETTIDEK